MEDTKKGPLTSYIKEEYEVSDLDEDDFKTKDVEHVNIDIADTSACTSTNDDEIRSSDPIKLPIEAGQSRKPSDKFYLHNHLVMVCQCCNVTYKKIYGKKLTNCPKCNDKLHCQCIACGKRYKNYCDITMHIRYDCGKPKRFICNICSYEARRKDRLDEHHKVVHKMQTSDLRCDKCGKTFKLMRYLRWHQNRECGDEALRQCPQCDFKTKYQSSMYSHTMNKHVRGDNVKHVCESCDKVFKARSALLTHKRAQCGKEPNVHCEHCEYKTYLRYPGMARHIQRNHPELYPKNEFQCKHCGKNLNHQYGLNKHLKKSAKCAEMEKSMTSY